MKRHKPRALLPTAILLIVAATTVSAATLAEPPGDRELQRSLEAIRHVGPRGQGHAAAGPAWQRVAAARADQLGEILRAMDGANPLATNWLRAAVDTVAERTLADKRSLPIDALEQFLFDSSHGARPRRLAFEWLVHVDPQAAKRLVPRMLDDSSLELRRESVARLIDRARQIKGPEAVQLYRSALAAARDLDQVDTIANALKELGEKVDLASHLGFFTEWWLIGPFDNTEQKGFDVVYPPERTVDLKAEYAGKLGSVRWTLHQTSDAHGVVDLTRALDKHKGAIGYAGADFASNIETSAELRWGSINAVKVWWNGQLVGADEVYHTSMAPDQYRGRVHVRKGRNTVLIKVCQNEQTESWAQRWEFQVRLTDTLGGALPGKRGASVDLSGKR